MPVNASFDFRGEVVVVTGGGSGIGAGFCRGCAAAGATVVAADIDGEAARRVAEQAEGPGTVEAAALDVGDAEAVEAFFEDLLMRHGKVDSLVQSAAVQPRTPVMEMPREEWLKVMDVNLNSAFYAAQAVVPGMVERRRGSIVTFTSGLARMGWAKASAYATTKAAIIAFTKSLAHELVPHNVRANVIAPGVTDSPLFTGPNTDEEQEFFRRQRGVGTVEDVVDLLMFLVSDASDTLTGSVLDREIILSRSTQTAQPESR
ncbi:MAG: SDR family oxidoreductase [Actinomycetota bacterium]|nr:SDR family oxidoreductase [Actinomycetota bacterium]